jgi:hypothetical protein
MDHNTSRALPASALSRLQDTSGILRWRPLHVDQAPIQRTTTMIIK